MRQKLSIIFTYCWADGALKFNIQSENQQTKALCGLYCKGKEVVISENLLFPRQCRVDPWIYILFTEGFSGTPSLKLCTWSECQTCLTLAWHCAVLPALLPGLPDKTMKPIYTTDHFTNLNAQNSTFKLLWPM